MKMKRIGLGWGTCLGLPRSAPGYCHAFTTCADTDGICFTTWHLFIKESELNQKDLIAAPPPSHPSPLRAARFRVSQLHYVYIKTNQLERRTDKC